ncbi:MAG: aspartate aminotransferase family protein [Thermodesulfobacteriota bacterium]
MPGQAEQIKQEIMNRYLDRTKKSKVLSSEAAQYLPGGDTRSTVFYQPYPIFMAEGRGCRIKDHDGHEYIDFVNNFTSLIHGHAFPAVVAAARDQIGRGTALGAPIEAQIKHARHLLGRVPSLEQVRYCNSGTEATLFAMRAARAHTGKDIFIKMDGGYHGAHDFVEVNLIADFMAEDLPRTNLERGVPKCVASDLVIAPFNDLEAMERILGANRDRVAAVMVEPIMGAAGLIPPRPGYLEGLRQLCDRFGALLIFDEVITFRFSTGGYQAIAGVRPDLTALGKIIGGGFPVGAFGGRKDIMVRFDPRNPEHMSHGGTFNANNVTLVAGLAALEAYDQKAAERLNALGDQLRSGFQAAMNKVGIKGRAAGYGSLVGTIFTQREIKNAKDVVMGFLDSGELPTYLHLEMLNRGIHYVSRGMYALSTPMTEKEIDQTVAVFTDVLSMLKPMIAESSPALLAG